MDKRTVFIIGAGQLGSRHLQALKAVKTPLSITVIDPNAPSLQTAKERYEAVNVDGAVEHELAFSQSIPASGAVVDLVIVATNSNVRRKVVEEVLAGNQVKYFVLEKLLFQKKADYEDVALLLAKHKAQAWVNCSMRTMPFYAALREATGGGSIDVAVTGSQYGLVTNAIHYLDYIAYLTNCNDFTLDTSQLLPEVIPSKRPGFSELNGALYATFADGSTGHFRCFPTGNAPIQITIFGEHFRCVSREHEKRAWLSREDGAWKWHEETADIPYQSAMTTRVVEDVLATGSCPLTPYAFSMKTHQTLLEALQNFLQNKVGKPVDLYPFT